MLGYALVLNNGKRNIISSEEVINVHKKVLEEKEICYFSTGRHINFDPEILVLKTADKIYFANVVRTKSKENDWVPKVTTAIPQQFSAPNKTWFLIDALSEISEKELKEFICLDGTPLLDKIGNQGFRHSRFKMV